LKLSLKKAATSKGMCVQRRAFLFFRKNADRMEGLLILMTETPCPDVTGILDTIGSGRNNTALIIAAEKAAYPSDTYIYAASACDNFSYMEGVICQQLQKQWIFIQI